MAVFDADLNLRFTLHHGNSLIDAITVAKVIADKNYALLHSEDALPATKLLRNMKLRKSTHDTAVADLIHDSNFDFTTDMITQLETLAAFLPSYRIRLYTRVVPIRFYSVRWEGNNTAPRLITIAIFNDVYDIFNPTRTTIGKTICPACYEMFSNTRTHNCTEKCSACRTFNCEGARVPDFVCSDCNYVFHKMECYERHRMAERGGKPPCELFKRCITCLKNYSTHNLHFEPHVCGETEWCAQCHTHMNALTHDCCWTPPHWKTKAKLKEKQKKYTFVFFDFETVIIDDANNLHSYCDQWVNLVSYEICCQDCRDFPATTACTKCGTTRSGTIMHNAGEPKDIVTTRFMDLLLYDRRLDEAIVLAHNGARFDHHFLISPIIAKGIIPEIVMKGSAIMQLTVKPKTAGAHNKITLKDTFLMIPMSLASLPESYGFADSKKGNFPFLFNHPDRYGTTIDTLPSIEYYDPKHKKARDYKELLKWHAENNNTRFSFNEEFTAYCQNDVSILRKGTLLYMDAIIALCGYNPIIHCCTVAAVSFFILKYCYLKKGMLGILPDRRGYGSNDVQSKLAIKYIKWLESEEEREYQYSLRGGEYKIICDDGHSYKVDAYHAESKTVVEVLGCFSHGCRDHFKRDTINALNGKTMGELYDHTIYRLDQIRKEGYSVISIWEHEIKHMLKRDPHMKKFFANVQHFKRLNVEEAFFGARTQNYVLKADPEPDQPILHYDVVSMYPNALIKNDMPLGQPDVRTSQFLPILNGKLPYKGFYLVDILPPTNLRHPIVPQRVDGRLIFALCRRCGENLKNVPCIHTSDDDRKLHSAIYYKELQLAIDNGYTILQIHEVWSWPDEKWSSELFRSFLATFLKVKMESSGWPRENMTDTEKDKFIADIYEQEGILLEKAKVIFNPALRQTSKLQCNTVWGKFCEKPITLETVFTHMDEVHPHALDDRYEITSSKFLGNGIYMDTYKVLEEFRKAKKFTSLSIAAITTCEGRITLWQALHRLQERAYYCDTDSIIFKHDPNGDNLEDLQGSWLGKWTCETTGWEIIGFVSIACKAYSYKLRNVDTGEIKESVKLKGVTIDHAASETVHFNSMVEQVESLIIGEVKMLKTSRPMIVKKVGHISTRVQEKATRPVVNKLRYLPDFSTLPYGWMQPDELDI